MNTRINPFRKSVYGRRIGIAAAITALLLVAAVGSASALPCPAPGNTVITSSCELNQSYTVPTAGQYGYKIIADNVVIDGKGYKITGTMPASCGGGETNPCTCAGIINDNYDNALVKDLEITGFCTGIVVGVDALNAADNMTVTGCKIHDCGEPTGVTHGIHLVKATNCTITKNEIYNIDGTGKDAGCSGGGNGIFMYGEVTTKQGWYNNITCNNLYNNTKSGFFMKHQCMFCSISYNNATGNGEGGIVPMCKMSNFNTITYNNVSGNTDYGIETGGKNNTIKYNTANGNYYGIFIDAGAVMGGHGRYNVITNNTFCGNTYDDIYIAQNVHGYTNTVDNNTCNNGNNASYCNDWMCTNLLSVYYDFDDDGKYSPTSCPCGNGGLCAGSCCNPGLFNSSGATQHCAGGICQLSPGDDDCDCVPHYAPEETFSKPLEPGWNLISLPLTNATNMTVANIMGSVSGNYDKVYKYNATTRSWVSMSSPDTMENGVGYFIHMTSTNTWTYTGNAYTSMNVGLQPGLNMVGWLNCSKSISDGLSSIDGKYRYVARWNATARKFETYVPNAPPAFNKFTTMDRGEGYFISMKEAATLTESC